MTDTAQAGAEETREEAFPAAKVVYEIDGRVIDPDVTDKDDPKFVPNRILRSLIRKQGEKAARKFGDVVHPETGERPTIKVSIPRPRAIGASLQATVALVTDDPAMDAWLKTQNIKTQSWS